ncbi:hypothetical protein [Flavobacterium sp. RSSB_23]|uniref:hypothetical protein n=1 Tax=Flavobacterium sp. RSSB_23 TaxID=3447668 RepID=UPI003F3999E0
MLEKKENLQKNIFTVIQLLEANEDFELAEILRSANITAEQTGYDNWNGGIYFYTITIAISVERFVKLQSVELNAESTIQEKLEIILRPYEQIKIAEIIIVPESGQTDLLNISVNLTGWERIDRSLKEIKDRIKIAKNEEQYQAIGLLCRETIISLAQAIYDKDRHPTIDNVAPSKTDANRMIEAYIKAEFAGSTNENLRKYAKASLSLANEVTHKRTATGKDVSICATATISLVNLIGILENRH